MVSAGTTPPAQFVPLIANVTSSTRNLFPAAPALSKKINKSACVAVAGTVLLHVKYAQLVDDVVSPSVELRMVVVVALVKYRILRRIVRVPDVFRT